MSYSGGSLTVGSVKRIYEKNEDGEPILQIVDIKKMIGQGGRERYRLIISDSVHFIQSMLGTQMHQYMENEEVKQFSIIKLTDHVCNEVPGKNGPTKVAIILNFEIVGFHNEVIGIPDNIDKVTQKSDVIKQEVQQHQQQHQQQSYNSTSQYQMGMQQSESLLGSDTPLVEISKINFYLVRWMIKARCSFVGDIKQWSNDRSSGTLLTIHLLDESGEIRATLFNDAVEKYGAVFKVGNIYTISKAQIKQANKKFSNLKHDFELTIDPDTIVQVAPSSDVSSMKIPRMHFSFVDIFSISDSSKDDIVDIIGIVHKIKPLETKVFGTREVSMRTIDIIDNTNRGISCAFWGEKAEQFSEQRLQGNPVIAIKGCKVSDFRGRALSTMTTSQIELNPDLDKTRELRQWFDNKDESYFESHIIYLSNVSTGGGSSWVQKTIGQIKSESNQRTGTDFVKIIASITNIKKEQNFFYKSCISDECKKKVREEDDGRFYCEKCQKHYDDYNLKYTFRMTISDHTGTQLLSVFNDPAKNIFGCDAKHLDMLKNDNEHAFDLMIEECKYKTFVFNVTVSEGFYNGEPTIDCKVSDASPINYAQEATKLIAKIEAM